MLSSLKAQLNHRLARIDAGEMVSHAQPLRKYATAPVGLSIGLFAMGYNIAHAHNGQARKKTFVRDALVIVGITLGSIVASRLVHKKQLPHRWTHNLIKRVNRWIDQLGLSPKHKLHGHSHDVPITEFVAQNNTAVKRLKSLFGHTMHSHGIEGSLNLSLLSALPIFAGGIPFGTLADAINGEAWQKSLGLKIKEGLFQFIGNITMCTVAILAFTNGSVGLTKRLWNKWPAFQRHMIQSTANKLEKLGKLPHTNLRKIPGKLTQVIEHTLLNHGNKLAHAQVDLVNGLVKNTLKDHPNWVSAIQPQWEKTYQPRLIAALNQKQSGRKQVRKVLQEFFAEHMNRDVAYILSKTNGGKWEHSKDLAEIARSRALAQGEIAGVVPGVIAGVFGGALASNGINNLLTRWFNLPETHTVSGFFEPHHYGHSTKTPHNHHTLTQTDDGWLAGKLGGPRGLHWFDWMLHLDDAPSAFYLMGVEALESVIQVLYGISGFIAGTAGTDYSHPETNTPPQTNPLVVWPTADAPQHLWAMEQHVRELCHYDNTRLITQNALAQAE